MIRRPPRSTHCISSAASDVYKRQYQRRVHGLDYLPQDYTGRAKILEILNQVSAGIKKYQDPQTGLWYQVLDQGTRSGNYLEATGSSMFTYALLKAVRKGYISNNYKAVATKAYSGILEKLIKTNSDGTISLTQCCSVAGLGGNPYRDGTYEYYINEPVRDNDPKGVGPFIMASLEYSINNQRNTQTQQLSMMKMYQSLLGKVCLLALFVIFTGAQLHAQKVTGVVVDETNLPLPGVNVVVKGTTPCTLR
eukprot:TRINITY_DN13726_c0_g1_i1.p1 TRINITY_DN13726_c0_g1~~TRINITY_DN13726_c0_g1_i1.p1  ORF type:complete len:250 (-),score=19.82 TRINITY_DN13726_c0_g1_i1:147-896(-)